MGNQLAPLSSQQPDYSNLPEAGTGGSLQFQAKLGGGRFLKTLKCVNEDGILVVKVYFKRDPGRVLASYEELLTEVRARLTINGAPNVMAFRWFKETPQAAYIVRQYFYTSLLERMRSPPFLTTVEKRWIAFQLLQALVQCHAVGVCHGDIKAENVMLTSSNWLLLTDLANFKPPMLPQDDPADFSYFFDSSSRRACYLAPERFFEPGSAAAAAAKAGGNRGVGLEPPMDIFSAGCVTIELLLEGEPCLDLPRLLKYRRGEHELEPTLAKVQSAPFRELLRAMTARAPAERPSAAACLERVRGVVFPVAFYTFVHGFFGELRLMDHTRQAEHICDRYELLLRELGPPGAAAAAAKAREGGADRGAAAGAASGEDGGGYLRRVEECWRTGDAAAPAAGGASSSAAASSSSSAAAAAKPPLVAEGTVVSAAAGSSVLSSIVGAVAGAASGAATAAATAVGTPAAAAAAVPSARGGSSEAWGEAGEGGGLILVVTSLCCCLRNLRSPLLTLRAMRMLLRVALQCDDAVRTGRALPYLVAMASDQTPSVRAEAVGLIATLLSSVRTLEPSDTRLMPDYVLPALARAASDPEEQVRCALAAHIGEVAETAQRLLEAAAAWSKWPSWRRP